VYVNDVTDDDDDDTRMAVQVDSGDYVDVADKSELYSSVGGSSTEHYSSVGERSPPNPYATLGSPPTDNVYSDVDPTCSENTYTGLGARSPPNVYLSIGQTPDGGKRY